MNQVGFRIMNRWNVMVAHVDGDSSLWASVVVVSGLALGYGAFGGIDPFWLSLLCKAGFAAWVVITVRLGIRSVESHRGALRIEEDALIIETGGRERRYRLSGGTFEYGYGVSGRYARRQGTVCHVTTRDGVVRLYGSRHTLPDRALYTLPEAWDFDVLLDQVDFIEVREVIESSSLRWKVAEKGTEWIVDDERHGIFRLDMGRRSRPIIFILPVVATALLSFLLAPSLMAVARRPGSGMMLAMLIEGGIFLGLLAIVYLFRGRKRSLTIDDDYLVITDTESGRELHRVPRGHLVVERLRYSVALRYSISRVDGDAVRISAPTLRSFVIGCGTGRGAAGPRVSKVDYAVDLTNWERLRRALRF